MLSRSSMYTALRIVCSFVTRGSNWMRIFPVTGFACVLLTPCICRRRISRLCFPCPDHPGKCTRTRPGMVWRTRGSSATPTLIYAPCFFLEEDQSSEHVSSGICCVKCSGIPYGCQAPLTGIRAVCVQHNLAHEVEGVIALAPCVINKKAERSAVESVKLCT